jgi:DNA polymerase-3 subunit delta
MIIKVFEFNKLKTSNYKFYLFYGKNEGLQNEIIKKYFVDKFEGQVDKYDENEFISNSETIFSELLNKSLFENEKILIISRVSQN